MGKCGDCKWLVKNSSGNGETAVETKNNIEFTVTAGVCKNKNENMPYIRDDNYETIMFPVDFGCIYFER